MNQSPVKRMQAAKRQENERVAKLIAQRIAAITKSDIEAEAKIQWQKDGLVGRIRVSRFSKESTYQENQ